jgi:hypothetical protein
MATFAAQTTRATRTPAARSASTLSARRIELRRELPWLFLTVGTALAAAAATSAWMVESIHLF